MVGSTVPPVVIIVAMNSELRHLVLPGTTSEAGRDDVWPETRLAVGELPVVAIRSGIGMVAAAAATEHAIATHRPRAILNFGCAGSHVRDQYPGDVVIGSGAVAHATVRIAQGGEEIFASNVFSVGNDNQAANVFSCNPGLIELAQAAAAGWQPDPWPVGDAPRAPGVHLGYIGSADIWTQHPARLDILHSRHKTLCEDMEAAAIAQIAGLHGVPFLTIKDISNNEFLDPTDFSDEGAGILESELGRRAAELTWRVLERMEP
jgi:adenosylhomocysteine nucleosidase